MWGHHVGTRQAIEPGGRAPDALINDKGTYTKDLHGHFKNLVRSLAAAISQ